jgi:predicted short-subunit dehydrogenase-like oxidoreductase (DUF2520 family)
VGIIGPGRAGLGLAVALSRAGYRVIGVHGRRDKMVPRGVRLTVGGGPPWLADAEVVLLAVRDEALVGCVAELGVAEGLRTGQVVLHLSGALSSEALAPLRSRGPAVGSMHPLMTVSADPISAWRHFRGATFALEGDFDAVLAAERMARALGGSPVMIAPEAKAPYHAGAVVASNYVAALLDAAIELLGRAGIEREAAVTALLPLARATLDNVERVGPAQALTGPIVRGDAATVRRHLMVIGPEIEPLYRAVGMATLRLAREAGLSDERAREVTAALSSFAPPA